MMKGVNLGNWLVLEKWMSPELFDGTTAEDETYLCKQLSEEAKRERLKVHRDSYITGRDFAYLAGKGIDSVRIPVPFFIFGDFEPYVGCVEYLDKAFDWAEKYGMRVLIDLHTVPDSQNGFDNGGLCGVCKWHKNQGYVEFALNVLEQLTIRYRNRPGFWGIEVLNEPISQELWDFIHQSNRYVAVDQEYAKGSEPVPTEFLKHFYTEAYRRIRVHSDAVVVVFHDGFRIKEWISFLKEPDFKNFIVDTHPYLMMYTLQTGDASLKGCLEHIGSVFTKTVEEMVDHFPIIIGEWSLYTGSQEAMTYGKKEKEVYYRTLADAQLRVWENAVGWFFWSYKLHIDEPEADGWDMGKEMDLGHFPIYDGTGNPSATD